MQIDVKTRFDAQGKENNMNIIRSLDFEYNYVETVHVVTVLYKQTIRQADRTVTQVTHTNTIIT